MHMMKVLDFKTVMSERGTFARAEMGDEIRVGFPYETYVLLDI